jgi:hypothetical protein
MSISRSLFLAAALVSSVSAFAAVSPVGTWNAHLSMTALPNATAAQKKKMEERRAKFATLKIVLTLKADHTFKSTVNGSQKFPTQNGKWALTGNKVVLTAPPNPEAQTFDYAKDGKSMSLKLGLGDGATGHLVFTR